MRSLGLRARVTGAFALLALVLSAAIALSGWLVVRRTLLAERQTSAVAEASVNAGVTARQLELDRLSLPAVLETLPGKDSVAALVRHGDDWVGSDPRVDPDRLPDGLVDAAAGDETAVETFVEPTLGGALLAVAQPMPGSDVFVELFPLEPVRSTIHRLGWALAGAAVLTAAAGALLGRSASDLALRPLTEVTQVARSVAGGRLDARLRPTGDPDLDPLAASFNDTVEHLEHRVLADSRFAADVKRRLERVVVNLVTNAETHGGGCTGVVVARDGEGAGDVVTVTVDDAGPGVPQALRDQVFDRFSRGRRTTAPGLGLGLAIVQRHVAAHGGEVSVGESPEGGARFVVRLPVR